MNLLTKELQQVKIQFTQTVDEVADINVSEECEFCDALLIANPIRFNKIKSVLRSSGIRKRILSLNNLLFDLEYYLEADL